MNSSDRFTFWNVKEASTYTRIKPQTLANMRSAGRGPAWLKLPNGSVRYRSDLLGSWMNSGLTGTTDQSVTS